MVGFEIAVRKASKFYTLADFARMGLFINNVITGIFQQSWA